jgi:signal transduction histidine kinase
MMDQTGLIFARGLTGLLGMSVAFGLAFMTLINPYRSRVNLLFAAFALTLLAFFSLIFLRSIPGLLPNNIQLSVLQLLGTLLCMVVVAYYAFVVQFTATSIRAVKVFSAGVFLLVPIVIWMVWTNQVFSEIGADATSFRLTTMGVLLFAVAILYGLLTVWLVFRISDTRSVWLRGPTVLLVVAYFLDLIWTTYPFSNVLFIFVMVWSSWIVMHAQIFNPMREMNNQLQESNARLQVVLEETKREKVQIDLLNRELQTVDRYKSDFMAAMSHELRTPLNAVIGYSELLLSMVYGSLNEFQTDRLNRIHRNSMHLLGLINAVLDLTHLETGRMQIQRESFDLALLVQEVVIQTRPLAEKKDIAISVQATQKYPLLADRVRLHQALFNIVENAIKFTHEGSVQIAICAYPGEGAPDFRMMLPDQHWIVVSVKDTGIGIPPESQQRIFVSFAQADSSSTREYGGIGLGLAITKRLVDLHGGRIWLESIPGTGSCFYIALPDGGMS